MIVKSEFIVNSYFSIQKPRKNQPSKSTINIFLSKFDSSLEASTSELTKQDKGNLR